MDIFKNNLAPLETINNNFEKQLVDNAINSINTANCSEIETARIINNFNLITRYMRKNNTDTLPAGNNWQYTLQQGGEYVLRYKASSDEKTTDIQ